MVSVRKGGTHSNEHSLAVDLLLPQLLRRAIHDVRLISDGIEGPEPVRLLLRQVVTSLLERHRVGVPQAGKDIRLASATNRLRKGVVSLDAEVGIVAVLEGEVGRDGNAVVEEERAEVASYGKPVVHDGRGTGALAGDGDARRVAAELAYEELHPGEGKSLVEEARVDDSVPLHVRRRKETKRIELISPSRTISI